VRRILKDEPAVLNYQKLRTRKSASARLAYVHIPWTTIWRSYKSTKPYEIGKDRIRAALPSAKVTMHMEPYQAEPSY